MAGDFFPNWDIGLQAIGDAYSDLQTIDFARQVCEEVGGFQPPSGFTLIRAELDLRQPL